MFSTVNYAFNQAITGLTHQYPTLLKKIGLPVIATCIVSIFSADPSTQSVAVLLGIIDTIIMAIIAVNIHQHILATEHSYSHKNYFIYLLWILIIGIVIATITLPLILLIQQTIPAALALLIFPLFYVYCRMSLVLPDRAIGRSTSIRTIWTYSTGQVLKLIVALWLIPIVLTIFLAIMINLILPAGIISTLLTTILYTMVIALEVALLSVTYRDLHAINETTQKDSP